MYKQYLDKWKSSKHWLACEYCLQKSQDQYIKSWSASVNESSTCINYRIFKSEHKFEKYLITLPTKLRSTFKNFRLCNNMLPIETWRWLYIDRNLRKCT